MKAELKNYEKFIGKLTEIKPSFIKGLVTLVFTNEEKTIRVRYGVVGSKLLENRGVLYNRSYKKAFN